MCGRYTQGRAIPNLVDEYLRRGLQLVLAEQEIAPSYNIAPGTRPGVIVREGGSLHLRAMRWGFVPEWAKSLEAVKYNPINAQSETVDSKPFFRDAVKRKRCLVPATGFYEWKGAKPPKQPYFISLADGALFSFAGLWSCWKPTGGGDVLYTFTILTTVANERMQPIHGRMPCILSPDAEKVWLADTDTQTLKSLLRPFPADLMRAYPVSRAVNRPGTDGPELIQPLESPLSGNPDSLF